MYNDKNLIYIFTILEAIEKILEYSNDFGEAEDFFFANSQLQFNATVNLLIAIGEESKKIDDNIKNDFNFPWKNIAKMRDKISHNYRGIDPDLVWDILHDSLIKLKEILIIAVRNTDDFENALEDVLQSRYYLHLRYLKSDNKGKPWQL